MLSCNSKKFDLPALLIAAGTDNIGISNFVEIDIYNRQLIYFLPIFADYLVAQTRGAIFEPLTTSNDVVTCEENYRSLVELRCACSDNCRWSLLLGQHNIFCAIIKVW